MGGYRILPTPDERRTADQRAASEHQDIFVIRFRQKRAIASLDEIWEKYREETCHTIYVASPAK